MANEKETVLDAKYTTVISNAIGAFDAIYDALATFTNLNAPGTEDKFSVSANKANGKIPVSKYSGAIGALTYISGATAGSNLTADANNAAGLTITYGAQPAVAGTLTAAGYHTANAPLTLSGLTFDPVIGLSGSLSSVSAVTEVRNGSDELTGWQIRPAANHIIQGVDIAMAEVTGSLAKTGEDSGASIKAFANSTGEDTLSAISFGNSTNKGTGYEIAITATPQYSYEATFTPSVALTTAGYLADSSQIASGSAIAIDINDSEGTAGTYYVDIAKASATGTYGSEVTGITLGGMQAAGNGATDADSYLITATSAPSASITSVSEGYLKATNEITLTADNGVRTGTTRIAKGSLVAPTGDALVGTIAIGSGAVNAGGTKYEVPVSFSHDGLAVTVNEGYIKSEQGISITGVSGSNTVEIPTTSVTITGSDISALSVAGTGAGIVLASAPSGNYKEFTVSGSTSLSKGTINAGYLPGSSSVTCPSTISASDTFYIKEGSVSSTVSSATLKRVEVEDGKIGTTGDTTSIAWTDIVPANATKDYYQLDLASSMNFVEGYISSKGTEGTLTKYIPRATFKYVVNSTSGDYLQVETPGYITSGIIANIADISGSPDLAAVSFTPSNADTIVTAAKNGTLDNYPVSGAFAVGGAGYISENEGTKTIGAAYVKHGAISITGTATPASTGSVSGNSGSYKISGAGSVAISKDLTEGYIKAADATVTNENNTVSVGFEVSLADAEVELDESAISVDFTHSLTEGTSAENGYLVSAALDDAQITVGGKTAGWVGTDWSQNLNVTLTNSSFYVKKGTKLTTVSGSDNAAEHAISATPTWDSTNNKYDFTMAGYSIPVSGTLAEGYYKDTVNELPVSGSATVNARTLELGKAQLSVSAGTANCNIDATGMTTYASAAAAGSNYLTINASASNATAGTASVTTQGYIGNNFAASDVTVAAPAVNAAAPLYVKVYREGYDGTEQVNTVTIGGQTYDEDDSSVVTDNETEKTILTSGQYHDKNLKITLHEDAMGSSVAANVLALENRLAGF